MHHAHLPQLTKAQSGLSIDHSGTLSSGGTNGSDGIGSPRCLTRGMSMEDAESNYVNIQYYMFKKKNVGSRGEDVGIDPSDDELDALDEDDANEEFERARRQSTHVRGFKQV